MKNAQSANGATHVTENRTSEMVTTVVAWVEAMQGRGGTHDALRLISDLTMSDAVAVYRILHRGDTVETVAVSHREAGKTFTSHSWEPLFPLNVLKGAAAGSFWTKAEIFDEKIATVLPRRAGEPTSTEIVVIVLDSGESEMVVLESRFYRHPFQPGMTALTFMAEHLSNAWMRRVHGVDCVSTLRLVENSVDEQEQSRREILTHQNPYDLSRTEFRICMLLSSGASVKVIAETSGIREQTVRTHLSSIYSKVGVDGQLQLLHQLMETTSKTA